MAAVLEAATVGGLPARVLARVGGDRRLTDLRHIGEALHEVALTERLGLVSLLTWLRGQVAEAADGRGTERTRRLDSDAAAVQLVTIHASKGLEYPVVYLPALADRNVPKPTTPLFHDADGRRCLDVGGARRRLDRPLPPLGRRGGRRVAAAALRRRSPAPSRRSSRWWAPTRTPSASPLHRMLMRPTAPAAEVPAESAATGPTTRSSSSSRGGATRGGPVPEPAVQPTPATTRRARPLRILAVRRFTRDVDAAWRRTSYSSLTTVDVADRSRPASPASRRWSARTTRSSTAPTQSAAWRDAAPTVALADGRAAGRARRSARWCTPCSSTPTPRPPTCAPSCSATSTSSSSGGRSTSTARSSPTRWSRSATHRSAACVAGRRCAQIPLRDRLREMEFELPLAGGDVRDAGDVRLGDLAPLLRRHLPEGDPVRAYADALDRRPLGGQTLRGYLTGSVDVVLRVPGRPRYLVVDYKTNWLGPGDEPLTADAYRPEALDAAMGHSDYPLQALLYAAVLHRFLRWRQPGYDPEQHLGGVLYLYLRGMCGPDTPLVDGEPCGVFAWRPPVALVEELSDLLDGTVPARRPDDRALRADRRPRLAARRAAATGLLADVQRGRRARRPSDVHVAARVGDARRRGRRAGAAGGRARGARGPPRLGLPRPRRRSAGGPRAALARRDRRGRTAVAALAAGRRPAWCGWSTACSTSTATTGSRPRCATTCVARADAAAARRRRGAAGGRGRVEVRGEHASDQQVEAAATAVRRWTTILTGGPGTGKTTTVARMLALLADQAAARGERISIALTAPTGKAATRLQEAVTAELAGLTGVPDAVARLGHPRA